MLCDEPLHLPWTECSARAARPSPTSVTTVAHRRHSPYRQVMAGQVEWVLFAYRMPREPSTPRITVWRKLRRLGVAQIVDGLVALPLDARTKEQMEWLADEVVEAGGDATVWLGRLGTARSERDLAGRMAEAIAVEYRAVAEAAHAALEEADTTGRRKLARLRRELHRIGQRDYFPPAERAEARRAVEALAGRTAVPV
jgi:hypothetical protein